MHIPGEHHSDAQKSPLVSGLQWLCQEQQRSFQGPEKPTSSQGFGSIDTAVFQVCIHPDAWNRLKGPAKKREEIDGNGDDDAEETEIPLEAIEEGMEVIDDRSLRRN